jgi:RNA polymerase sigma factor (sigma-70 family)
VWGIISLAVLIAELKLMSSEDQEIITRFLGEEIEAVRIIEGWIARAASPFRQRLASHWEDALQEISLEVTRLLERGTFRGEASLKTYLWRVANHYCIRQLRTQTRVQWLDLDSIVEQPRPSEHSPLDQLLEKESESLLLRVLEETTDECRKLWRMILDGLSYQQMSHRVGASEGALRVKVLRCRKRAVAVREQLLGKKQEIGM